MAMRNFWIETKIDGRKTNLTGGPKNKHGGLTTSLYIRNDGCSELACKIVCEENDAILTVRIFDDNGVLIHEHKRLR